MRSPSINRVRVGGTPARWSFEYCYVVTLVRWYVGTLVRWYVGTLVRWLPGIHCIACFQFILKTQTRSKLLLVLRKLAYFVITLAKERVCSPDRPRQVSNSFTSID